MCLLFFSPAERMARINQISNATVYRVNNLSFEGARTIGQAESVKPVGEETL